MKGGPQRTRKGKPKNTPKEKVTSESNQATEESNEVPGSDVAIVSQSIASSLPSTPKRGRGRIRQTQDPCVTSTPVRNSSTVNISESPTGAKQVALEFSELITRSMTSTVDSTCSKSKSQSKRSQASHPRQVAKRATKTKRQACSKTKGPPAKCRRGRPQKIETGDLQRDAVAQSFQRSRPRFELEEPDADQDESLLSSDLSIELSHQEDQLLLSYQEDEDSEEEEEEEEEELPSFLMQADKKPPPITEGVFVWHKFRNYPFWPALVKSVYRKQKKASVVFIDDPMIHKKKGFTVALKTLKPFYCEEANELMCKAKEKYDAAIVWAWELIKDYSIRIACGSFSGSFIEYFAHDMSYPVRREYPQAASERLSITSDAAMEVPCDDHKGDSVSEQQERVSGTTKRLLPDRSHAAHNRANEKLVHYIVKQRMVEKRLLAVIHKEQPSRWLRSFLSANRRRVVNTYLEDDHQLDQVYLYLNDLYATAVATDPHPTEVERVPFVLDVLLPEAIIYAIAGVDNISLKKAEEKYLKGRCISNRERQQFDLMIERQMRTKSQSQSPALGVIL